LATCNEGTEGEQAESDRRKMCELHGAASVWPLTRSPDPRRRGFRDHEIGGLNPPSGGRSPVGRHLESRPAWVDGDVTGRVAPACVQG
jgi:hypothetical protein